MKNTDIGCVLSSAIVLKKRTDHSRKCAHWITGRRLKWNSKCFDFARNIAPHDKLHINISWGFLLLHTCVHCLHFSIGRRHQRLNLSTQWWSKAYLHRMIETREWLCSANWSCTGKYMLKITLKRKIKNNLLSRLLLVQPRTTCPSHSTQDENFS